MRVFKVGGTSWHGHSGSLWYKKEEHHSGGTGCEFMVAPNEGGGLKRICRLQVNAWNIEHENARELKGHSI